MINLDFRALPGTGRHVGAPLSAIACTARRGAALLALLLTFLVTSSNVLAGIVIEGTRVIYRGGAPEVVVKMSNEGATAVLMQAWIDDGRANATPDQLSEVPFFLTPPLARIEPGKGQTLRIFHTEGHAPLASDRETLFWLNVLDIPPKQEDVQDAGAVLQISVRSRLKLFFRPKGLPGSAELAPDSLVFRSKSGRIELSNPTPYYVNLRDLEIGPKEHPTKRLPATMIAPFSSVTLDVPAPLPARIRYTSISDLGAIFDFEKPVVAGQP